MIFVVPRCRACQVENTIQNCLVSSILSCMLRDRVSGSHHIKEAHCLHLQRHSSCATWLLKIKALFGNHVPSDAPHIPYDHNPRLTAVKTAKLTWRTCLGKVLLAIVYEDYMYYTYEKCSKVFCQIYLILCTVLTSSQLWIFSHRIERVGLENLSFLA
jgi:hypothetical protein